VFGCGPLDELDDASVGGGHLEQALASGLFAQRHGDGGARRSQPGFLRGQVGDGEGEDQTARLPVALLGGQDVGAPAEQDDVDGGIPRAREEKPSSAMATW
jgi:hypothetical protein